jgi:hypothetical protein
MEQAEESIARFLVFNWSRSFDHRRERLGWV